jgi:hypothetical protein
MKQILPSLQRFHIETIMYLIVIIVALVLLYLFMNNKINLFEGFQTGTMLTTPAAAAAGGASQGNVAGCPVEVDGIGQYTLFFYHNEECPDSNSFKEAIWDKIFISQSDSDVTCRDEDEQRGDACDGDPNAKLSCINPSLVNPTSVTQSSTHPNSAGLTQDTPSYDSYYNRGYYYIHPFFERWFKEIFIIKRCGDDKHKIEFIKLANPNYRTIINKLVMDGKTITAGEDVVEINTGINKNFSPIIENGTIGEWDDNVIDHHMGSAPVNTHFQKLIEDYVTNHVLSPTKLDINYTPAVIIEDTEHIGRTDNGVFTDSSKYNYKLTTPKTIINDNITHDDDSQIYNLILMGEKLGTTKAELLEYKFYDDVIKFIDERHEMFDDLGCSQTPSITKESNIYVYYGDNCEQSYNCINEIIDNYNSLDLSAYKVKLINIKKDACGGETSILCMREYTKFDNITDKVYENIEYLDYNNPDENNNTLVHYDINYEFIQNYDKNNLKIPYIILFYRYHETTIRESFEWYDLNHESKGLIQYINKFNTKIKNYEANLNPSTAGATDS